MCKLKHLAVAAALIGFATHVQAGYFAGSTDFEGAAPLSDGLWSNVGESEIVADASVASVPRAANRPPTFNETIRTNVLGVDGDTPIVRSLQSGGAAPSAATIYADALVKGYPLAADASAPEAGTGDKILVYTRISQDGTATNLCVLAAASDADSTATEFVLTKSIGKDEWHRIIIKATATGYQVYCDGVEAANLCKTSGDVVTFYALTAGDPMTSVAFQGTGYVDDLILSDLDPANLVHTLVWGEGFDSVSYTVDGVAGESLEGVASPYAFQAPAGSKVILTGDTGYRTFAETNTIGSASMSLALPSVTGIAKYFPQSATADQDGSAEHPYEIPNLAALKALQAAATETNCFGLCFLQTADIALDAAWPGIGLQNGKDIYSSAAFDAAAFCGTYDGGNFTVSNFQMVGVAGNPASTTEGLDYCGFFNSTYGATICNLKIAYAGSLFAADTTADTKESGATFVGVAKDSRLRNLTTLAGTVSCSKGFGGISGYTTSGTVIDSCTNNLNMTSLAKNKCGGIAMITQGGSAVTITNCQNNGTQTTESSNSEYGAIVGYVGVNTTISDCETTVGRFLKNEKKTVTLLGVNKGDARVPSYHGSATPGLNFATVEGDVATFVADDTLAAGNTYKVMATGATATYAFTAPGTISFDTALFTPTYAITAPGLALTDATDGTVKTYTAAAITAATWIGGAQGDWQTAANWDVGYVPTKDTVVTFTNDCAVGIYRGECNCKEMVLNNAKVTVVRADQGSGYTGGVDLHFEGNEGRAVSGTGTLGLDTVGLFNNNNSGALTIGTGLAILNSVTFKGVKDNNQHAGSWTITGDTTIANVSGLTVKSIDDATLTFQGDIDIASGAEVTFLAGFGTGNHGAAIIVNSTYVTLAHPAEGSVTKLMLDTTTAHPNGTITINGQVVTDDPGYTVEITDSGKTYTVVAAAPAYPTYLEYADNAIKDAYDAWKVSNGADTESAYEKQFLLNVEPATDVPDAALVITAIKQNATAGWDITVECALANVGLEGTVGSARVNNGYLAVLYTDDLTGAWTAENINITASANGQVTVNVNKANAKFMKAKLSCTAEPAAQ